MSQIQYNFNKNDEYRTPAYAVYPILKRLKRVPFQSCYLCQGICKRQLEFDYLDTSLLE